MKNGLIPEQRVDVNGKLTTRWVKAGADGKPVPRGIPAPKSSTAKETAMRVRMVLHPETQTYDEFPDEEYAVRMDGTSTFYSPEFAQQTMERMPVRTLKLLEETLGQLPYGVASRAVAQTCYDLIKEMYDMGQSVAAPAVMKFQSQIVSNACIFSGMSEAISRVTKDSVSLHMFMIDQSLDAYEHDGVTEGEPMRSATDYATFPLARREAAQNYVMADQLHRHFGNPVERLPEDAVKLTSDYRGQWGRLAEVVRDRGFSSLEAIRLVMDSEVPAVSEGAL